MTHWQKLRLNVFRNQRRLCADCGERKPLELHHLTYLPEWDHDPTENPLYTWETEEHVVGLCRDCHRNRHVAFGVFYRDPEEVDFINERFDWLMVRDA